MEIRHAHKKPVFSGASLNIERTHLQSFCNSQKTGVNKFLSSRPIEHANEWMLKTKVQVQSRHN